MSTKALLGQEGNKYTMRLDFPKFQVPKEHFLAGPINLDFLACFVFLGHSNVVELFEIPITFIPVRI
ncbi:MAG TPA: hypothetical protein DEF34_12950 [Desulfotomaculum sp.]|nr:MAG: hypothetical protein JL56_08280 [Desulfotomaculum sp. BICA1-6]HBX24519.1 hypothetical protein [Desulfotomaculum sp.]